MTEAEAVMPEPTMTAKIVPAEAEVSQLVPVAKTKLAPFQVVTPEAAVMAILDRLCRIGSGVNCRQVARCKRCRRTG